MKFSIRTLALLVAWIAIVATLIARIRWEAVEQSWAWNLAPDIILILNLVFTLVVILLAIAIRSEQQIFWIGCAVVATALFVCQVTDVQPRALGRNMSLWMLSVMVPADAMGAAQKESHAMQLTTVLVFSLTPLLSLAGGAFTQWVHRRSAP